MIKHILLSLFLLSSGFFNPSNAAERPERDFKEDNVGHLQNYARAEIFGKITQETLYSLPIHVPQDIQNQAQGLSQKQKKAFIEWYLKEACKTKYDVDYSRFHEDRRVLTLGDIFGMDIRRGNDQTDEYYNKGRGPSPSELFFDAVYFNGKGSGLLNSQNLYDLGYTYWFWHWMSLGKTLRQPAKTGCMVYGVVSNNISYVSSGFSSVAKAAWNKSCCANSRHQA